MLGSRAPVLCPESHSIRVTALVTGGGHARRHRDELRHGWRTLTRRPGFLAGAIGTLALGIGATITVFSIVNAVVLRPLPFGDRTGRLVTLHATHPRGSETPGWGDAEIVGRGVLINDRLRTVVGILPPGFRFPERDDLYLPLRLDEGPRSARVVNAVALLRDGVTLDQARSELQAMARWLAEIHPSNRG